MIWEEGWVRGGDEKKIIIDGLCTILSFKMLNLGYSFVLRSLNIFPYI